MQKYHRTPRSAGPLGLMPSLGLQSSLGLVPSLGVIPSLGRTIGNTLFSFRITDGITDWTFTRATSATYHRVSV